MKFPRLLRVINLLLYALSFGLGIVVSAYHPEIPQKAKALIEGEGGGPPKPPAQPKPPTPPKMPTTEQCNEVLSGSLALVEAQYTYYVHVTHNTKFAGSIKELGSVDDPKGGTVMVPPVWNASDAVSKPKPIQGYFFQCMPVVRAEGEKEGFAVLAYPAKELTWPLFLSIIPDVKGGLLGISAYDTWEIQDVNAAKEIRALSQKGRLNMTDLDKYSPEHGKRGGKSFLIHSFKKNTDPKPEGAEAKPQEAAAKEDGAAKPEGTEAKPEVR